MGPTGGQGSVVLGEGCRGWRVRCGAVASVWAGDDEGRFWGRCTYELLRRSDGDGGSGKGQAGPYRRLDLQSNTVDANLEFWIGCRKIACQLDKKCISRATC